jgi:hypothetical protein
MTCSDRIQTSSETTKHRVVRYHRLERAVIRIAKDMTDVAPSYAWLGQVNA